MALRGIHVTGPVCPRIALSGYDKDHRTTGVKGIAYERACVKLMLSAAKPHSYWLDDDMRDTKGGVPLVLAVKPGMADLHDLLRVARFVLSRQGRVKNKAVSMGLSVP